MKWCGRALILVVALGIVGCGSGDPETGGGSPTSPTPTNNNPAPGPSGSCAPAVPSNLAASISGSRVSITWNAVSNVNDYMVYIGTTQGSSNVLSTNTTQTNYQWNGGDKGTYYVRVEARGACGSSGPSGSITVVIAS